MIFRRNKDEMEGFRRMREALRQQADPQDHALLDEQYDDEELPLADEEMELADGELVEVDEVAEYSQYAEEQQRPSSQFSPVAVVPSRPEATSLATTEPPAASSMTTIGADTSWSGTLRSESNVYLEGKVEGTLEVRDTIYIADRATIDARIKAHSVVVSGQFTGYINCDGRLEVTPTGRLSGEVEVGSLVVHEGAILDGKFKMKSGAATPAR